MRRQTMILPVVTLLALSFVATPWGSAAAADEKWGPFRGRIVDIDTGEPIAGGVAMAIWLEIIPTPVQTNHKFYDVRVGVSDQDGVFEIPRREPPFFSSRIERRPLFDYFAPGYGLVGLVTAPDATRIAQMRKRTALSQEERLRGPGTGNVDWIPQEKLMELTRSANAQRQGMGLRSIPSLRGGP